MSSPLRVYWDEQNGWTVDTPIALSRPQADAVVAWTKKIQGERVKSMRGDKREQAEKALRNLTAKTLKQNLLHSKSEGVLWTG